jgi:hypothetical protein
MRSWQRGFRGVPVHIYGSAGIPLSPAEHTRILLAARRQVQKRYIPESLEAEKALRESIEAFFNELGIQRDEIMEFLNRTFEKFVFDTFPCKEKEKLYDIFFWYCITIKPDLSEKFRASGFNYNDKCFTELEKKMIQGFQKGSRRLGDLYKKDHSLAKPIVERY